MTTEEVEMTLAQFIESKWFKLLARAASIAGFALAGGAMTYFLALGGRVTAIEQDRALRIQANDTRLTAIEQKIGAVQADIGSVKNDTATLTKDTSVMRGILLELQRRDTASLRAPAFDASDFAQLLDHRSGP